MLRLILFWKGRPVIWYTGKTFYTSWWWWGGKCFEGGGLGVFEGTNLKLAWIKMRELMKKLTRPRMEMDIPENRFYCIYLNCK